MERIREGMIVEYHVIDSGFNPAKESYSSFVSQYISINSHYIK